MLRRKLLSRLVLNSSEMPFWDHYGFRSWGAYEDGFVNGIAAELDLVACLNQYEGDGCYCTRLKDHEGDHIAHDEDAWEFDEEYAEWERWSNEED